MSRFDVVKRDNPHLLLTFSDPISTTQDVSGLIRVNNKNISSIYISNNTIKVFPGNNYPGYATLIIDGKLKNSDGIELGEDISQQFRFSLHKPAVEFVGQDVIIPKSDKSVLIPFKTIGLSGVDIRITEIPDRNIGQYLQINNLKGDNELKRVGTIIRTKQLELKHLPEESPLNWKNYTLDLSDFIATKPGVIYHIELGFRQHHNLYPCDTENEVSTSNTVTSLATSPYDDPEYWNKFDYYTYDYRTYNWRESDNPCNPSYYGHKRTKQRNVLTSDLGLIAKLGESGDGIVAVTHIKNSQPISRVDISVFDFQQNQIASGKTNTGGFMKLSGAKKPYYLIARKDNERGYLKLNDAEALSLSSFDVTGKSLSNNLKGYIYGERGVWRPGDSLFVTLLIEDKYNTIPNNHPVLFELKNALGQIVDRQINASGQNGFYTYIYRASTQDPTGMWDLSARVGGTYFTKRLLIETIRPNRLKVNLEVNQKKENDKNIVLGKVSSNWLHGTPASGLKYDVQLSYKNGSYSLSNFDNYDFSNPLAQVETEESSISAKILNNDGTAWFKHELNTKKNLPQTTWLQFRTRVFEKSGAFSSTTTSEVWYPYDDLTGILIHDIDERGYVPNNKPVELKIIALNSDGTIIKNKPLTIEIYELEWQWWWERTNENLSNYIERKHLKPIHTQTVSAQESKGRTSVKLNFNQRYYGRYIIVATNKESGAAAAKTFSFKWSSSIASNLGTGAAERLFPESDKDVYKTNEKAKITFPAFKNGRSLISVENSNSVLDAYWLTTDSNNGVIKIDLKPAYTPNVYVSILTIQPHNSKMTDRPMRMYGVVPIQVTDLETVLLPEITMANELEPEKDFGVTISEKNGKSMTYTVAIVDEGLLDLTNFKTPNPRNLFYAKEALGVNTWDIYSYVARPNPFASVNGDYDGGDGSDITKVADNELSRFKPVVMFAGPFTLKKGESKTHTFTMPSYIGSVKSMVVAGNNGAYGSKSTTSKVKKPLMVLASAPRTLSAGERAIIPVSVFNLENKPSDVDVSIATNSIFTVKGASNQKTLFKKAGEKNVYFEIEVNDGVGVGTIEVTAVSAGQVASYSIEMQVKHPFLPITTFNHEKINPDQSWKTEIETFGVTGTNEAIIELSHLPSLNLNNRLNYLIQYPHGCIEQTVSAIFAQLHLNKLLKANDKQTQKIQENINAGINRLKLFQLSDGSLSYWPGIYYSSEWGSIYTFHFLTEAKALGYYVTDDLYKGLKRYIEIEVQNWRYQELSRSELIQSYRLYTLALSGYADLSAMNRLNGKYYMNDLELWYLAAAYSLVNQGETALQLIDNAPKAINDYRELSHTFGSGLRDRAIILETLTQLKLYDEADTYVNEIISELGSDQWLSTQETAYSFIALSKYAAASLSDSKLNAALTISGQMYDIDSKFVVHQQVIDIEESGKAEIVVANQSEKPIYINLIQRGLPKTDKSMDQAYQLNQKVVYKNISGEIVRLQELKQGDDVVVEVHVTHPGTRGDYQELALTHILPSGWEISNARLESSNFPESESFFTYQDIRDDRVMTYFNLKKGETKIFRTKANVSYQGDFILPPITTTAMYDESIRATTKGSKLTISL